MQLPTDKKALRHEGRTYSWWTRGQKSRAICRCGGKKRLDDRRQKALQQKAPGTHSSKPHGSEPLQTEGPMAPKAQVKQPPGMGP